MNDIFSKLDGYKVYLTAAAMALGAINIMYTSITTGEGDFNSGMAMLFEALAIAGFRSTATKLIK